MADEPTEASAPAPKPERAPDPDAAKADQVKEIIRSHLRSSPISRDVNAWNFLEAQLAAIAADILKEA